MQNDDPDTPVSHRTFNTICKYIGVDPAKARLDLEDWTEKHKTWVKSVTASYLDGKKIKLDRFLDQWLHPQFPLSMPGILIIARAYKIHIAIFFNDSYWTTMSKTNLMKVTVFLLYRGNLIFEDSQLMTTQEYGGRKQYFLKLQKYFEETDDVNALDRMRARSKKDEPKKPVIESDIEELSSKSADIMLTGEEESEPQESDDSDTGYHKTNNNLPVPCSECSRKKTFAKVLNCKKCSRCAQGKSDALPPIGSSDDLDLENILDEAAETDIMQKEENNTKEELDKTETEKESKTDTKVNIENDIMQKTEDAKADIKVTETEKKLNAHGFDDKKKLQIKLTDIMRITKNNVNGNKSESSSSSGSSGSTSESSSSSGSSQPPPPPPKPKKRKLSEFWPVDP